MHRRPLTTHELLQALENLPLSVALISPERRLSYMNRSMSALTGFVGSECRGVSCAHILRGGACYQACPVAKLAVSDKTVSFESDIINRDRQIVPVRVTVSAIRDPSGHITGYLETMEDLRFLRSQTAEFVRNLGAARVVGKSPEMEQIFQTLPFMAQTDASLLITGETGTGKDMIAEAVHQSSKRAKGPFVKVNCGALPESLLESELFGYRKGAFTGAVENKPGRIQLAHNGTLFLTEIGDLPLPLQVKLLSFLDDKVIYPLGDTKGFVANVRVIAATHRDLEDMVRQGSFRKDLMFRLNVLRVHLPPLRSRGGDRRLLLEHFIHVCANHFGKRIPGVDDAARDILLNYAYPGNVRELKNIVEYACTMCQGDTIAPCDLPPYLAESGPHEPVFAAVTETGQGGPATGLPPMARSIEAMERETILAALAASGGRMGKAAQRLGWARSTLWRKIRQHGLKEGQ